MTIESNKKKTPTQPSKDDETPNAIKSKILNRDEIVKHLHGRTLMVYFVLLNKKLIGVRDLQRHLDLSSPSVAKYHLEKLVNLNLVENRNGVYHLDLPVFMELKHIVPNLKNRDLSMF